MNQQTEQFRTNAQGHKVPLSLIKQVDLDRDELIDELFSKAKSLREQMATFKQAAMGDIYAFVELAAEKYEVNIGGKKGNLSLTSFDGLHQIRISIANTLHFDERAQAAKSLIEECVDEWTQDTRAEVKTIVEHAFKTNSDGQLSVSKILGLFRLDIKDEKWQRGMEALKDSMQVVSSNSYIRFYYKPHPDSKFIQMPLDMPSV